ncbi:unnamed protein product [Acanthoscelides obtectus]|uniref:Uncharacterized protein n=1 Tax=Acanthoscelides obtectus TaxID=200917 RepID=A0A9P0KFC3_ACAOB|nr:unnamed protein product [Acanthoscelides obtectus]CAK1627838.1 Leucine-rich repeat-containing protein 15 [Acanthoscelides obtectus]
MTRWLLAFAALAAALAEATPPTPKAPLLLPTKIKSCIEHCKCKLNKLAVIECDRPIILNSTTFRYINKPQTSTVSFENVIIDQIEEDAFSDFPNLGDILILNSHIGSIDAKAFNNVKRVKFARCRFEDRPDLVSEKMEELHFGECQLEEIPKLNGLLKLTFLNLTGNYIKDIDIDAFAELFDLEELYLSNNEIFKIPPTLFINNDNLAGLYLDNNQLRHFYLNTSENLETLSLKNCSLELFDEKSAQRLSDLNDLNLSHNKLKTITGRTMSFMKELAIINLSHNKLSKLDDDIFAYNTNLMKIVLDGNNFEALPNFYLHNGDFIAYSFSCKHCGLKTLPASAFKHMKSMTSLELSHNKLMNVDNSFQNITSLKLLDISYNNVVYFAPYTFVNNKNLEYLNIAGNPLMTLNPEVFAVMPVLKLINARNATLSKLWSNYNKSLKDLQKLLLSDNRLTSLSIDDFRITPSLTAIDLFNNPLVFTEKLCKVLNWLDLKGVNPIEKFRSYEFPFDDSYDIIMSWTQLHNNNCQVQSTTTVTTIPIDDEDNDDDDDDTTDRYDEAYYDDEDDIVEEEVKKFAESNFTRASYILSITSAFVLSAVVVLTVAVTLTLCILKRNSNFNMHEANLPRVKIPLWNTTPGQKKHSGSVYRPLSEDLSGPKTPKLSRYEFTATPTVHSSNP